MDTFFDAGVAPRFHLSVSEAREAAHIEAVDTGSLVLAVRSLEMAPGRLVFVGDLPASGVAHSRSSGGGRRRAETPALGRFHTTWSMFIRPEAVLGYLILRQPVTITSNSDSEDGRITVAVGVSRRPSNPDVLAVVGPICCSRCNQLVPPSRLAAVPGTHTCVRCQEEKENAYVE
jgi:hypothetical protein